MIGVIDYPYKSNQRIDHLQRVRDVRKLEECQPAMVIIPDVVIEDHQETDEKIGSHETTETSQGLLIQNVPWSMAYSQEDGLKSVNEYETLKIMSNEGKVWALRQLNGLEISMRKELTWLSFLRSLGRRGVEALEAPLLLALEEALMFLLPSDEALFFVLSEALFLLLEPMVTVWNC